MAEISASMVMDLRQRTGLGMMECKKALTEAAGDPAKAEELLRIRSGAKASKAASRVAAEGVIGLHVAPDAKTAAMAEVNCETDFVAKNEDFRAFASDVAALVAREEPADPAALAAKALPSGETVESRRVALVQKIGENITIRRFARCAAKGRIASYVHGGKDRRARRSDRRTGRARQGSRDARRGEQADGGHGRSGAGGRHRQERSIAAARAAESGKPANIVEKMVEGAVAKYLAEVTLLAQPFVKGDGKQTVGQLVKAQGAAVNGFVLFVVGEGIEKKKDDFAAEVAAMAKT
jgi:elongation factor Ts